MSPFLARCLHPYSITLVKVSIFNLPIAVSHPLNFSYVILLGESRKAAKATSITAVRQKTFKELTVVRRSTCQAFKETNPKTIHWLICHNFIDPFCSDCQLMLQGKEMVVMFVSELKPIEMSFKVIGTGYSRKPQKLE